MMKEMNLSAKIASMFPAKQCLSIGFIILLASLSSACQTTTQLASPATEITNESLKYSQYYLWLKTLNNKQLLQEEHQQAALMTSHLTSQVNDKPLSLGKLILIYSLPNPLLHQPYKAKRLLNEHLLSSNNMSDDNLAFTLLLRDQLNTQLRLLEKQTLSSEDFNKLSDEHHAIIEQLNQQLDHVKQQMMLLKQIDQNINERG